LLNSYRFISDIEPTDEQLSALMHEVAIEAKIKADIAIKELHTKIHEMIRINNEK
jgi:hypothetical protein